MASFYELAEGLLTTGIDAYAETQQVRYQANQPASNSRGANDVTAVTGQPVGSPLTDTLVATFTNPTNLVLLGIALVLGVVLAKRL